MNVSQKRIWLCWSSRQNCFHIESEEDGVRTNYRAFKRGAGADYVPIAVFTSQMQAAKAADELRSVLIRRAELFGHPAENAEN